MFIFENPSYLYLALIIPVIVLIYFVSRKRMTRRLNKHITSDMLNNLAPERSGVRNITKFTLTTTAVLLLVIMLARPQMAMKTSSKETKKGIEVMIAVDISNSMLAEDVAPSRLSKSKLLVENLIDKLNNDKIGLVVFAGDAFVQMPITSDYISAKMFIDGISPKLIQLQGTNIADAIELSANSFTQEKGIGRAIIIVTDGEDHEGKTLEAAKMAKEKGISLFVLGIGTPEGAPIPLQGNEYIRDENGEVVISVMNEQMCKQVAQAGGGTYIHVDNTNDAQETLINELDKFQKGEVVSTFYSDKSEQFQAFGILAIIVLIIEICILERKSKVFKSLKIFRNRQKKALSIILLLLSVCTLNTYAQSERNNIRIGNVAYARQNFSEAETEYRKALAINKDNPQALYNLGCALMMQQKDSAAISYFQNAGKIETSKKRKAMSYHNIGAICQKHQLYAEAIEAYKQTLRNNPADNETRYNLALCKRMRNNQQNNQQNKQNDSNNKDNSEEESKQKDKEQQKQGDTNNEEQMSKDNAEQLLNAAIQEEKETQERIKQKMQAPNSRRLRKNW